MCALLTHIHGSGLKGGQMVIRLDVCCGSYAPFRSKGRMHSHLITSSDHHRDKILYHDSLDSGLSNRPGSHGRCEARGSLGGKDRDSPELKTRMNEASYRSQLSHARSGKYRYSA